MSSIKIYKTLLTVLKYRKDDYKLETDEKGYFCTREVLKALRILHPEYKYITALDIRHSATCDIKKRVEITKDLTKIKLTA